MSEFCPIKVGHGPSTSFCTLPPGHAGDCAFHLHGDRADAVVNHLVRSLESTERLAEERRRGMMSLMDEADAARKDARDWKTIAEMHAKTLREYAGSK